MSKIVCLDSFIEVIKDIEKHPELDTFLEKSDDVNLLCASSPVFIQHAEDSVIDKVMEIELSAGYYIFNDFGMVKPIAVKKLLDNGFVVVRLSESYHPFSHGVKSDKFTVLVSN